MNMISRLKMNEIALSERYSKTMKQWRYESRTEH